MIGSLRGIVLSEEPTGGVILDVNGVGYELLCPVGTLGRVTKDSAENVQLFVHTNVRQDALDLFGFASLEERTTFRELINVPNVGPKTAIVILSALPAHELAQVIESEDKARLGKVPGIGKKTAERLVLELRGKLAPSPSLDRAKLTAPKTGREEKLILALTGLGYRGPEAEKAAKVALQEAPSEENLSALLRSALRHLSA